MIHIGINPNIGSIGSFTIAWHGVMMTIGILSGVWLTWFLAKKQGIPTEVSISAAVWGVACGIIGSRVSWALDPVNLGVWRHPTELLAIQNGGMGWYGGLIGGSLAVVIYFWIKKLPLARFADAAAPGVILGLSIGRIGCTINGDAAGTPTSLPWGFVYTNPNSFAPLWTATHPYPVYEILWNMVILVVLWRLWKRLSPDGSLLLVMLAAYSFGRFCLSFLKDEVSVLGPLHQSHIISLALFVFSVALLAYRKARLVKPERAVARDEVIP